MTLRKDRVAVVLDMGANGLGVARSLGHYGIRVIGMDFAPRPAGFHSRYAQGVRCPDPITRPKELMDHLASQGDELADKGVLYPCTDAFLLFVSRNRKELSKYYELTLPREEVTEGLVKKIVQYKWAKELGVPIPQTFFPKDLEEGREIGKELYYPAFIKGQESHLWARQFMNKGFIVRGPEELERGLARAFDADLKVVVQKVIMPPGKNFMSIGGYIGKNGQSTPMLTWQKVRQSPPNFGIGSFMISKIVPELSELGLRFMKGIDFVGPSVISFKFDQEEKEWKLIEMNGRIWFQNYFLCKCGYNLPLIQYHDALGEPFPKMGQFKEGVRYWDSLADFDTFVRLRREGRIGSAEWIRSWFLPDVTPYYEKGDVWPALAQGRYGLAFAKGVVALLKMKSDEDASWDKQDLVD